VSESVSELVSELVKELVSELGRLTKMWCCLFDKDVVLPFSMRRCVELIW